MAFQEKDEWVGLGCFYIIKLTIYTPDTHTITD